MELTKSNEDYLEVIGLLVREHGSAQVKEIAAAMKVKMPSVSSAVKHLAELGLVEYVQYAPVKLTARGKALADRVIASHEIVHEFLESVLGLPNERACDVACAMEHIMMPEEITSLKELTNKIMNHRDIFGLPDFRVGAGAMHKRLNFEKLTLDMAKPGQQVIVEHISPNLRGISKFADMGLVPGAELGIERSAPLGDPIRVRLRNVCVIFRKNEAKYIRIRLIEK